MHNETETAQAESEDRTSEPTEKKTRQSSKYILVSQNEDGEVDVVHVDRKAEFLQVVNSTNDTIIAAYHGRPIELKRQEAYTF